MGWLYKTKIWWKGQMCYMDTNSFIVYVFIDDIYKDIAEYVGIEDEKAKSTKKCVEKENLN